MTNPAYSLTLSRLLKVDGKRKQIRLILPLEAGSHCGC
jgi:hypothetical protein